MKRSKKAGGYNLRKSLAWDRAFFTEEGVLNDSELSMISGCDRNSLCVIDEQARDLLPAQSDTNYSSADVESLEEDLSKKSPSGYLNKRNATCSSFMKQVSKTGGSLASVSRCAQKVSPGHGLKKGVCKEVPSSPMVSTSQKRLNSNRKILTRNSKIPKVQVSKKNPPVRSVTAIQSAAGGSSLESSGIPQPVARKSLSSKLSSNVKQTSNAAKASLESTPKSIKPSANVGDDATNSTLRMHSLMSLKAPHTTKKSKHQENNSSQDLLTVGADIVKFSGGRSSTAALSLVHTDNAGLIRKSAKVLGNKPSGLRMPSPALRFFSETNSMPPKVLKSIIPSSRTPKVADHTKPTQLLQQALNVDRKVADHTLDCKPIQLLQQALNVDPTGKAESCSQRTDKYSASSIVPKVRAKLLADKFNEKEVELGVPLGHDNSKSTNNEQFRYSNLDGFEMQYIDQVPTSFKVKEQYSKDSKSTFSHPGLEEDSFPATILSQENKTADRKMLDGSYESCPEVQLTEACEINREPQLSRDVEFNSSVTTNDVILESQAYLTGHQNFSMLAPDVGSSSSILDGNDTPGESMEVQLDDRNLFADGKSYGRLEEDNHVVPGCIGGVMAVQERKISEEVSRICNESCSITGRSKCKHTEDKQDEVMSDSKLSNMKLCKSSETQHEAIEKYDTWKRNSINVNHYNKDICNVSLEVGELSRHGAPTLPKLSNEDPVEPYHLCKLDQVEELRLTSRHEIADNCASADDASIGYEQCSAIIEYSYAEVERQQILNNEAGLNYSIVSWDCFCMINQEETNARVFGDIDKVKHSVEEVKDQTDMHLPNYDDGSTHQNTRLEIQSSAMRCKDQAVIAVTEPDTEETWREPDTEETWREPDIVNKNVIPPSYEFVGATPEANNKSDKPECNLAPRETCDNTCDTEGIHDKSAITKQRTDNQKLTRPPPNAVPFSDEWLAAIEFAGEDILTLKTGAVKHSPPDKSIPEPSPWSPVKWKTNQVIGPFDCTKYTNAYPDTIL